MGLGWPCCSQSGAFPCATLQECPVPAQPLAPWFTSWEAWRWVMCNKGLLSEEVFCALKWLQQCGVVCVYFGIYKQSSSRMP